LNFLKAQCRLPLFALLLAAVTTSCAQMRPRQGAEPKPMVFRTVTINNLEPRCDLTGEIVDAHDGCLQFFGGRYYLK